MQPFHRLLLTIGITLMLFGLLWNSGLEGKKVYYGDQTQRSAATVPSAVSGKSGDSRVSNSTNADPIDYFR